MRFRHRFTPSEQEDFDPWDSRSRPTQGVSDFGKPGYGGPMPPEGHGVHNYFFWLLALDADLALEPGIGMWDLLERIEPHVIGMNRLVGTYQRG